MKEKNMGNMESSIHNLVKLGLREHASIQLGASDIYFSQLRPNSRTQIVIITWFYEPGAKDRMLIQY